MNREISPGPAELSAKPTFAIDDWHLSLGFMELINKMHAVTIQWGKVKKIRIMMYLMSTYSEVTEDFLFRNRICNKKGQACTMNSMFQV